MKNLIGKVGYSAKIAHYAKTKKNAKKNIFSSIFDNFQESIFAFSDNKEERKTLILDPYCKSSCLLSKTTTP